MERVVAVINGKGGVGKTSTVANLAGAFAADGLKVLVVDLDVQGNLVLDFGVADHAGNDLGQSQYEAVTQQRPLQLVENIRPGIDWLPGGVKLNWLIPIKLAGSGIIPNGVDAAWRDALKQVANSYDLILLDCPPGNRQLQEIALAAAGWILVPTKSDAASIEGVLALGPMVKAARVTNPELKWMGLVLFAHQLSATAIRSQVQDAVAESTIPLLESFIRFSEATAHACRDRGLLAAELAKIAPTTSERLQALRARRTNPAAPMPAQISKTSSSLAEDYKHLAEEIAAKLVSA